MRLPWRALALGGLAVTAVACEDGLNFCTNRDDAGQCPEIPDFIRDGGVDATTPPSDASASGDAMTLADATVGMDAATDAGSDAATPSRYSVEDYCAAQYSVARAWRDLFGDCCPNSATAAEERSLFLLSALLYEDGSGGTESVDGCVSGINASVGPNLTFDGAAAVACAARFAAQFTKPPTACPADGFRIEQLEATIGHRAQSTAQMVECRTAFAGKVARNGACTSSFQCAGGNRCLGSDNSRTCQPALSVTNPCTATSQCADGFICQGSTGAGKSCQPLDTPVPPTANCSYSTECENGYVCDATCVLPAATAYCKP
jgi:hypothetical protein